MGRKNVKLHRGELGILQFGLGRTLYVWCIKESSVRWKRRNEARISKGEKRESAKTNERLGKGRGDKGTWGKEGGAKGPNVNGKSGKEGGQRQ